MPYQQHGQVQHPTFAMVVAGSGGGIASVRTAELVRAAGVLGVATGDVSVYDIPQLRVGQPVEKQPLSF